MAGCEARHFFVYILLYCAHLFVPLQANFQLENIMKKNINRIKVVLVEKNRTNKWLAAQLNIAPSTVSKWCTNDVQPSLETLMRLAILLDVKVDDLLRIDEFKMLDE